MPRSTFHACLRLALALLLPLVAGAQAPRRPATPYSLWLDFAALGSANPPKLALPAWVESLQSDFVEAPGGGVAKTTFRLRFRPQAELDRDLLFRIVFDDIKGRSPVLTGWSAAGALLFEHGPFGASLNLPTSATVTLPMFGVSFIDITVPGDGSNIRGAFLSYLRRGEILYPRDSATPIDVPDAFDNLPSVPPPAEDTLRLGRLRATLDAGTVRLAPKKKITQVWEFELTANPLVAILSFEVLNADPLSPLEVTVNDRPLGPAAMRAPDLADPGYQGVLRNLDRGVRFRYAGWLQCQKAIPGSALHTGLNKIELRLPAESGPVAVRSLDLQLKTQWQTLAPQATPSSP